MTALFPTYDKTLDFKAEEGEIELIKLAVKGIRAVRTEMNVPPSKKVKMFVVSENDDVLSAFGAGKAFFAALSGASEVAVSTDKTGVDADAVSVALPGGAVYMPLNELVDISKELERLNKEREKLTQEVDRVTKKLANEGFVAKAPAKVIDEEKAKMAKYEATLKQVEERIKELS
jgi:valyl-tRNA synthetase